MRYLILLAGILITISLNAQTKGSAKLYAYKQGSSRGAAPKTDEQGNVVHSNKEATYNYYLYLVTAARVYPSEIWLNNTVYNVTYKKVNSPVEIGNANLPINPTKKVLVPKTSSMVLQLTPTTATQRKSSLRLSQKMKANELVVIYKQKGKFRYSSLSSIPLLESAALQ